MDPVVVSAVAQPGQISLYHLIMQASWPVFLVMVGLAKLEGSSDEWVGFVLDLTEQRKADRSGQAIRRHQCISEGEWWCYM